MLMLLQKTFHAYSNLWLTILRVVVHASFLQADKKESVGFFPLSSLGHSGLRILHCAGPHPQVHAVLFSACFLYCSSNTM